MHILYGFVRLCLSAIFSLMFIIPLVMSVVSTAWLGNAYMQHHNRENFMFSIMIPPSLSLILIYLEWGLDITRVKLIFSFKHNGQTYPCVPVHWFSKINEEMDFNTGMWQVEPDFHFKGEALYVVMCLGCNKDQWSQSSKCISYVALRGAVWEQWNGLLMWYQGVQRTEKQGFRMVQ